MPHLAAAIAGLAWLFWLAVGALREGGAIALRAEGRPASLLLVARRGALINVLAPKLSIFFLALLPPFLSGDPAATTGEMITLGGLFMALTFVVFVAYGVLAARVRARLLASEAALRWLNRCFAAAFAVLAGRFAFEKA